MCLHCSFLQGSLRKRSQSLLVSSKLCTAASKSRVSRDVVTPALYTILLSHTLKQRICDTNSNGKQAIEDSLLNDVLEDLELADNHSWVL